MVGRLIAMPNLTGEWRRVTLVGSAVAGAVLWGAACSGSDQTKIAHGARGGVGSLAMDSSYVEESCAPNDGPAVTLFFGGRAGAVGTGEAVKPPYVTVSIWRGWSTLTGQTFLLRPAAGGGSASYCRAEKKCERLDYVRVSFETVTNDRMRGTADLTLQEADGHHFVSTYQASIPFNARRLNVKMMCG